MDEEKSSVVLAHAQVEPPVVPEGGCIVFWTAATLKAVLAHTEAQAVADSGNGIKPQGFCFVFWT